MNYSEAQRVIGELVDIALPHTDSFDEDMYEKADLAQAIIKQYEAEQTEKIQHLEKMLSDSDADDTRLDALLNPCPVCGAKMSLIKQLCVSTKFTSYRIYHSGQKCPLSDISTRLRETAEEAVFEWNNKINNMKGKV